MSSKEWRHSKDISISSSLLKDINFDTLKNIDISSTNQDDNILIWLDESINKDEEDDQYTISQIRLIINPLITFTNEEKCLMFINKYRIKNKLFLIVSGKLGEKFLPKINNLSQINSIYIFCGKKFFHELWAKKYNKVKGVFDDINNLCTNLKCDKQKFQQDQIFQKFINSLSKNFSSSNKFNQLLNIKNSKYNDHQPSDDSKISIRSADIPFSKDLHGVVMNDIKKNSYICASETVVPFVKYNQQMEFSDNGIWPCLGVVDDIRNEVFHYIYSITRTVKYFHSINNCLQHINNHCDDPHLIILCNPKKNEHLLRLIHSRVRKLYIYCPNNSIDDHILLSKKYPKIVSILQHFESLTSSILWDLSACIVDIGNYYHGENKENLAQTRYAYAYRLHINFQVDLNNRIQLIKHT